MSLRMNALTELTCIDTCNGVARRVLRDLRPYSHLELTAMLRNDIQHGGSNFNEIIELAVLLQELKENL